MMAFVWERDFQKIHFKHIIKFELVIKLKLCQFKNCHIKPAESGNFLKPFLMTGASDLRPYF